MKIAFDLDGVVINLEPHLTAAIEEWYGKGSIVHAAPRLFTFSVPEVSHKNLGRVVVKVVKERTPIAEPIPGSIEALHEIYEITKAPIVFMTARSGRAVEMVTRDWLDRHLSVPYEIHFIPDKDKGGLLAEKKIDLFVDDRFKTIHSVAPNVRLAFLFDQPWNRDRAITLPNILRISSLAEIVPGMGMIKAA